MPSDRYRAHEPGKDSRRAYLVFAIGTFATLPEAEALAAGRLGRRPRRP